MEIRNVAVFCASATGTDPAFAEAAAELGRGLAGRGVGLIYGGANVGLMHAVAAACMGAGGRVIGVIPHVLVDKEVANHGLTELHVVDTMHTRKALMGDRADAFVILPGGYGTMEEMFEVLAWQTIGLHTKPVLLLNTSGFYDPLLAFLDGCVAQGVLRPGSRAVLRVANSVGEVMEMLSGS